MFNYKLILLIIIFLVLQAFIIAQAHAEYRVYRLGVKYDEKQKKEDEVLTTLDHLQYVSYYKVTPTEQVRLIDHWMCRGRTDNFRKYCSKPITPVAKVSSVTQASQSPTQPKPVPNTNLSPNSKPQAKSVPQQPVPVMLQ